MQKARIKLCWLPIEKGGKESLPLGTTYSTVVHFLDDKTWPDEAWSVVINFEDVPDKARCVEADLSFLSPDGPAYFLKEGAEFELFEGRQVVATEEVIGY